MRLFRNLSICVALTASACTLPATAQQDNCGPWEEVVKLLLDKYGETQQTIALSANNSVLETYASESGSWSILVTSAEGQACLVASGENFEIVASPFPLEGEEG